MADSPIFTERRIYQSRGSRPPRRRRLVVLGAVLVAAVLALWGSSAL